MFPFLLILTLVLQKSVKLCADK